LAVSEEDNFDVHLVDYEKRELTWTYGIPDARGSGEGMLLNYPDDAHLLEDGQVPHRRHPQLPRADHRPAQDTPGAAPSGAQPGSCRHKPPHELAWPNGATPLDNGDLLITEITDAWVSRITRAGQGGVERASAPKIRYPSDTFPTVDGKQAHRGRLLEARAGGDLRPGNTARSPGSTSSCRWRQDAWTTARSLANCPTPATCWWWTTCNDRVIVVDRKSKEIIWQYGEKGNKGFTPGLLNYPDGVDLDVFRDWKAALRK
jgi:hypothetical protein